MPTPKRYIRKVIRIKATDSPNVKYALAQIKQGLTPTGERLLPGVLSWEEYEQRRRTWDPIRQCVSLDGEFYEGAENLLFPPEWLNLAEQRAAQLSASRPGTTIGVDPAEGGDSTVWSVCDMQGLIYQESIKTPDTSVIVPRTIALMNEYRVKPADVWFDQGGGGGVHVDALRRKGYNVSEVFFGEPVIPDPVRYLKPWDVKIDERRERYNYKNRRAQMYHMIRLRLDPNTNEQVFGIPAKYTELRRQLAPIPLTYDQEGRVFLLPKKLSPTQAKKSADIRCLEELLGCSPDEADSLALAVYGLTPDSKPQKIKPLM